jgi:hypothetical protein
MTPRGLDLSAIQTELGEYRDFIDRWLEASELPKPVKLSDEEDALASAFAPQNCGVFQENIPNDADRCIPRPPCGFG